MKSTVLAFGLVLALSYVPLRHFYSILSFQLAPLPPPFSDPNFDSIASFPNSSSPSLRQVTIYNSNPNSTADLVNYDRLAFCEDAIVYRLGGPEGRRVGLLTCDPSRWEWNTVMGTLLNPRAASGSLWVVDPMRGGGGETKRVKLEWTDGENFHPLGIDVFPRSNPNDPDSLFVINHRETESTVELFNLSCTSCSLDCTASHVRSLSHDSFTGAPNSIAATSPTSFYLSHDHRFNLRTTSRFRKLLNSFETLFALPLSYVDFVSFSSPPPTPTTSDIVSTRAAADIAFANGVVLSPSGRTLVVASTTTRTLIHYSRDPSTSILSSKPYRTVTLPFLVDNLSVAPIDLFSRDDLELEIDHDKPSLCSSPSSPPLRESHSATAFRVNDQSEEDGFELIATGHPSFLHLVATAHRSAPFSLSSLIVTSTRLDLLARSIREPLEERLEKWLKGWEFDWTQTRGLSWSVLVPNPSLHERGRRTTTTTTTTTTSSERRGEWIDLYKSSGRRRGGRGGGNGYGTSSTTILARSSAISSRGDVDGEEQSGEKKKWMIVVGLYEEGVKVVVEE